jgi:uncharacterized protein
MPSSLTDVLQRVGQAPDFSGISVTCANTLGLFKARPLHTAAVWGDCEAIEILLKAGAVIDEPGEHGFTALMEAVAQNHVSACKLLVTLGAGPVPNSDGYIPSEYAVISGNQDLAQWLQAKGF